MTEQMGRRQLWAVAATFLSGIAVIFLYLALMRQHDVWFGRTGQTAVINGVCYALAALAGIGLALLVRNGGMAAAGACLLTAAAALFPLFFPGLLVDGWQALMLVPQGVAPDTALLGQCWRSALRLALPGLAAGFLVAGGNFGDGRLSWQNSVIFLLGVVLGSSLFRPLLAALQFDWLLAATAIAAAAAAALHLPATAPRGWRLAVGMALAAAVMALAVFVGKPPALLANAPLARWAAAGSAFSGSLAPVFHCDGGRASASVYYDQDYGRVLAIDGRPVAFETRFRAGRVIEAHIPLLLAPRVRRIALFGEEAPLAQATARAYAPALLACRGADKAILEAVDLFTADVTAGGLQPPLPPLAAGAGGGLYDVLHVMPGPAWTRQGKRALRAASFRRYGRVVAADGVVALTLEGRSLSPAAFQEVVRGFQEVFPHTQLWCTGLERWLLLGSRTPLRVPLERLQARFENGAVFRDLLGAGVTSLPELLSACVLDEAGAREFAAATLKDGGSVMAGALFVRGNARRVQAALEPFRAQRCDWLTGGADAEVAAALRRRVATLLAVRGVVVTQLVLPGVGDSVPPAIQTAAGYNRRDLLLRELTERIELEGVRRLAVGDAAGAIRRFEEILLLLPDDAVTHFRLSLAYARLGQRDPSFWHSGRAAALAPTTAVFRIRLAEAALQMGQREEAVRQYREALASDNGNIAVKVALARLLGDRETPGRDIKEAVRLAEEAFAQTGQRHAPTGYALADLYLEAGRVHEGVALKRAIRKWPQGAARK